MNDFICPKCSQPGLPSIYLPMCTACANIERRKSGEIKDDNAAQQSVHPTSFLFGLGIGIALASFIAIAVIYLNGCG